MHLQLSGVRLVAVLVVVALMDDDGQRAQLRRRHALVASSQQAVAQAPRHVAYPVPPPAAPAPHGGPSQHSSALLISWLGHIHWDTLPATLT